MGRIKGKNRVKINVSMPEDLSIWVKSKAREISLDTSAFVRMILIKARKEEQETGDASKPID